MRCKEIVFVKCAVRGGEGRGGEGRGGEAAAAATSMRAGGAGVTGLRRVTEFTDSPKLLSSSFRRVLNTLYNGHFKI
jgi:hypothetical protein